MNQALQPNRRCRTGLVLLLASASAVTACGAVAWAAAGDTAGSSLGASCDTPQGHRFDFWPGVWQVESRQRSADGGWHESTNVWTADPALDGCAYLDFTHGDYGGGEMKGMGSRFYDPAADRWTITWLSTLAPGRLGTWTGRFEGDRGDFYQSAEDGTTRSRISWFDLREDFARWSFAVSPDGGTTWQVVWEMTFRRADEPHSLDSNCGPAYDECADAAGASPGAESLLAADRAFAAASLALGARAWTENWTDRGMLYGTAEGTAVGPVETARKVAGVVGHLRWEPLTSSVLWPDSAGYTAGRWWTVTPDEGSGGGRYLTVWRRVDGRWKVSLHLRLPAQGESRPASDFDFWLGDWILQQGIWSGEGDSYEPYSARTRVRKINGGGAIVENYEGDVRFFWAGMEQPKRIRGMSVRFHDPDDEQWRIFWMDTVNPRFGPPFKGNFSGGSGEFLLLDRPNGLPPSRIVFAPHADGTVGWHLDIRTSGTGQWQPLWKITFQRQRADSP